MLWINKCKPDYNQIKMNFCPILYFYFNLNHVLMNLSYIRLNEKERNIQMDRNSLDLRKKKGNIPKASNCLGKRKDIQLRSNSLDIGIIQICNSSDFMTMSD